MASCMGQEWSAIQPPGKAKGQWTLPGRREWKRVRIKAPFRRSRGQPAPDSRLSGEAGPHLRATLNAETVSNPGEPSPGQMSPRCRGGARRRMPHNPPLEKVIRPGRRLRRERLDGGVLISHLGDPSPRIQPCRQPPEPARFFGRRLPGCGGIACERFGLFPQSLGVALTGCPQAVRRLHDEGIPRGVLDSRDLELEPVDLPEPRPRCLIRRELPGHGGRPRQFGLCPPVHQQPGDLAVASPCRQRQRGHGSTAGVRDGSPIGSRDGRGCNPGGQCVGVCPRFQQRSNRLQMPVVRRKMKRVILLGVLDAEFPNVMGEMPGLRVARPKRAVHGKNPDQEPPEKAAGAIHDTGHHEASVAGKGQVKPGP